MTTQEIKLHELAQECGRSFLAYRAWLPTKTKGDLSPREAMSNAALGLIGETGEFLRSLGAPVPYHDVADEFGDVAFYAGWLANLFSPGGNPSFLVDDPHSWAWGSHHIDTNGVLGLCSELAENVKKHAYHGVDRSPKIAELVAGILASTATALTGRRRKLDGEPLGSDMGRWAPALAIELNVRKLESRYPSGFRLGGGIRKAVTS